MDWQSLRKDFKVARVFSFHYVIFFKKTALLIVYMPYKYPFTMYNSRDFSIYPELYTHHHSQFSNIFITSKRNPSPFSCHLLPFIPSSPSNH